MIKRMARWSTYRWLPAAGLLLQTGSCTLLSPEGQAEIARQIVVPQISSVLSNILFFVLDNALVRLTT